MNAAGGVFRTVGRRGYWLAATAVVLLLLASAAPGGARTTQAKTQAGQEHCAVLQEFDRRAFTDPTRIDNRYLPLVPGAQYILEGVSNRTGLPLPHRVMFTVTDLTKKVNGVTSRVMWDVDVSDDQLAEAELAFFAQDRRGNVWNLGEYPEEYGLNEAGEYGFLGAPNTWIAGQEEAEAGIHMAKKPRVSSSPYLQGFAPAIDFLDCAEVVDTDAEVCVPAGCFDDVVITHESTPLDPAGGTQTKDHAPDVGIVAVGALDDPEGETLVLISIRRLGKSELKAVRQEALKLERRAYRISEVYGATARARVPEDDARSGDDARTGGSEPKQAETQSAPQTPQQAPPNPLRQLLGG
jgi:hypothetical protein